MYALYALDIIRMVPWPNKKIAYIYGSQMTKPIMKVKGTCSPNNARTLLSLVGLLAIRLVCGSCPPRAVGGLGRYGLGRYGLAWAAMAWAAMA